MAPGWVYILLLLPGVLLAWRANRYELGFLFWLLLTIAGPVLLVAWVMFMGRTGPLPSVILLFLPGVLLAWRAKRRGRRWLLWFLLAVAGPILVVLRIAFYV